jgi:uncharacterized membrane protein
MVLDHVRDYFHVDALLYVPTDPTRTTVALFATRWITHLCAPTFVFLAGASVYLQRARSADRGAVARFALVRGLWLIALELTLIAFAFNFAWPFLFLQVIWAIGLGLVLLSLLVWLPPRAVLALGIAIVAGHDLLAPVSADAFGRFAPAWRVLMEPGGLPPLPGFVAYPALPWFGIMALGYGLGGVWLQPGPRRDRLLVAGGLLAIVAFIALRVLNGYGDPLAWTTQPDATRTAMSFLNVSKYPPSLMYVLATLGVALAIAPALQRLRGPVARLLDTFGATPFFTYLLHIFLVHGLAMALAAAMDVDPSGFVNFIGDSTRLAKAGWGVSLLAVYAVWIAVLVALMPASAWMWRRKRASRSEWLRLI